MKKYIFSLILAVAFLATNFVPASAVDCLDSDFGPSTWIGHGIVTYPLSTNPHCTMIVEYCYNYDGINHDVWIAKVWYWSPGPDDGCSSFRDDFDDNPTETLDAIFEDLVFNRIDWSLIDPDAMTIYPCSTSVQSVWRLGHAACYGEWIAESQLPEDLQQDIAVYCPNFYSVLTDPNGGPQTNPIIFKKAECEATQYDGNECWQELFFCWENGEISRWTEDLGTALPCPSNCVGVCE